MTDMPAAAPRFTVFTTRTCGPCVRLKHRLDDLGVRYQEIDVEQDQAAAEWVRSVNQGDRVVPTVLFTDGSSMTNPSVEDVLAHLAGLDDPHP